MSGVEEPPRNEGIEEPQVQQPVFLVQAPSIMGGLNVEPFNMKASNLAVAWSDWKKHFEAGLNAFKCTDPVDKKNWLKFRGGSEILRLLETLPDLVNETAEDVDVYEVAIHKLDAHFFPKKNKTFERHVLRGIVQKDDEPFDAFVLRIRGQANNCSFGTFLPEAILDQIVEGCRSRELKTKCLATEMTLTETINLGTSLELVSEQIRALHGKSEQEETVNQVYARKINEKRRGAVHDDKNSDKECFNCGGKFFAGHRLQCKAKDHICKFCRKVGHLENKCYSRKRPKDPEKSQIPEKKRKVNDCFEVSESRFDNLEDEVFYIDGDTSMEFDVGLVKMKLVIDSGASANLIDETSYMRLNKQSFKHSLIPGGEFHKKFVAYATDKPLKVITAFRTSIGIAGVTKMADFYVIENGRKSLLGKKTAMELGVLKIQVPTEVNSVKQLGVFPHIRGVKAKLSVKEDVTPISQQVRRVPIALEEKVDAKIEELLALGIIERVDDPNPGWISPVVPVGKADGDLRICIDMRKANQAIMRESYPLPTFEQILGRLRKATVFSKLDLKNAYHQIELLPESRHITTFVTRKGLFRYCRLMFGISAAPEKFQKIMDNLLAGCEGVVAYIDDVLVFGVSREQHDQRLQRVLEIFNDRDVLLNREKCVIGVQSLVFMGHNITAAGISPLKSKIEDVKRFREPQNVEEVRSFLGLVTYHARFIPNLATISEPLRKLLKSEQPFVWDSAQEKSFKVLKNFLTSDDTLGFFDKEDITKLICDAGPVAVGAVLMQEDRKSHVSRIIAYASRSLSDTEKKYYQTEKEALSLVWGVERFKYYLTGLKFQLITDCKPLEFLFKPNSKPCARIERWILRLQSFDFTIMYKPGKTNLADPLSRLVQHAEEAESFDLDTEEYVFQVVNAPNRKIFSIQELREQSANDGQLSEVKRALQSGHWEKNLEQFRVIATEICEFDGLLLRGTRLIPPQRLKEKILEIGHEGHMGMTKMKQRLRASYWWPAMDKDIERFVKDCRSCVLVGTLDPPPPLSRKKLPDGPWIDLAMDFLGPIGSRAEHVFVVVDYYSRFMEIVIMQSTNAQKVIYELRKMIGRHGYPSTLTADNGPQFRSEELKKFCDEEGITLNLTTPYWPQANGEVERQNRSLMKRIKISVEQGRDWKEDLLTYQAAYHLTPHCVTQKSPAELFKGSVREKLPSLQKDPGLWEEQTRDADALAKEKGREYQDRKRKAAESGIEEGDLVLQKKMKKGSKLDATFDSEEFTVVQRKGNEVVIRSDESNTQYRRHVHHLKKLPPATETMDNSEQKSNGSAPVSGSPGDSGLISSGVDQQHGQSEPNERSKLSLRLKKKGEVWCLG